MITVGQHLGRYTIVQLLGKGGMGEVYLARHQYVARPAVIKILRPEFSQNQTIVDRFFTEARATSMIRHPGIVEIIDCDVVDGQAYIVMELLEGESLGGYLERVGALTQDLPMALSVGIGVAQSVGAAHAQNIIHRDLKPDNIYLHMTGGTGPLMIKVLDFGIAKLAQQGVASQTSTGVLMGTPSYMSPEQCQGAGRVDARSDVYSLGCILYEMVCGAPPFVREGVGNLILAHVTEAPVPPSRLVPGLPPDVDAAILATLAKRPEERPQTMEEVADRLRGAARSIGAAADGSMRPTRPVLRADIPTQVAVATPSPGRTSGTELLGSRPPSFPTSPASPSAMAVSGSGGVVQPSAPGSSGGYGSGPIAPSMPFAASGPVPSGPMGVATSGGVPGGPAEAQFSHGVAAGGTYVLPSSGPVSAPAPREPAIRDHTTKEPTTLGTSAGEKVSVVRSVTKSRLPMIIAGGLGAVAGVALLIAALGPSKKPPTVESHGRPTIGEGSPGAGSPPAGAAKIAVVGGEAEAPAGVPVVGGEDPAAAGKSGAAAGGTVRIDFKGVPDGTSVFVDGRSSGLPVQLPRGSERHRIVLRAPGGLERALELDGTADRTMEANLGRAAVANPPASVAGGEKGTSANHQPAAHGPGLSDTQIQNVVSGHSGVFQACAELATSGAGGKTTVAVAVAISTSGRVTSASVSGGSLDAKAAGCVVKEMRRLKFPSAGNATATMVPLALTLKGGATPPGTTPKKAKGAASMEAITDI